MNVRTSLVLAAAVAVGLLLPLRAADTTATTDGEAINQARALQNEAIASNRFDDVAAFWTDDVTLCRGLGNQLAGKAAYKKLFVEGARSASPLVYQRLPDAIEVSPLWPLAFETGVWRGHLGDVAGRVVISGRYSAQWVKRGDRWFIRAEVYVALDGAGEGRQFKAVP